MQSGFFRLVSYRCENLHLFNLAVTEAQLGFYPVLICPDEECSAPAKRRGYNGLLPRSIEERRRQSDRVRQAGHTTLTPTYRVNGKDYTKLIPVDRH